MYAKLEASPTEVLENSLFAQLYGNTVNVNGISVQCTYGTMEIK